jgi:hypothetical protein
VRPKSILSGAARVHAARAYPVLGDCQSCGARPARERHHRDGNEWNQAPENVALLCATCHRQTHLLTHCLRGHEFTPENTYTSPGGVRFCRACKRLRDRLSRRR